MKKILSILFMTIALFANEAKEEITIKVAGPFASVSHPIIRMAQNKSLKDMGINIEFVLWKNPDELRALILNGDINFIALPTNVAANLYNKGVDIKLLNVSILGDIRNDKQRS